MKPNFALDLSHDGIGLIHRAKAGWTLVDQVSLEAPDMAAGLALLRGKAADLESGGFSCKLILPQSQILFTSMIAGGDDVTRAARIREGLEGLTPYQVDDLVFDWHPDPSDGDMVHVAVVARETLDEAESFAHEHQLNPVSFVARPSGNFIGEPFFGPVSGGSAAGKAGVKRDKKPVPVMSGPVVPPAPPVVIPDLPVAPPEPKAVLSDFTDVVPTEDDDLPPARDPIPADDAKKPRVKPARSVPDLPELAPFPPTQDAPQTPPAAPTARADAPAAAPPKAKAPKATQPTPPAKTPPVSAPPPAVAFSTRRTDDPGTASDAAKSDPVEVQSRLSLGLERDKPAAQPKSPEPTAEAAPKKPAKAPPVHVPVTAPRAFGDDPALARSKVKTTTEAGAAKGKQAISSAAKKGAAGLAAAAGVAGNVGRKAAQKIEDRRKLRATGPDADPVKPGGPKPAVKPGQPTPAPTTTPLPQRLKDGEPSQRPKRAREAEALTIFGARQTENIGGKPKYLGLFLILGLLMLMAIVAIWSMFFLKDGTAWLFPERTDQFEAAISAQDESDLDEAAANDTPVITQPPIPGTGTAPLTPEAAQARYAATGIWQRAPEKLTDPTTDQLDDLYVASIDPKTGAEDAIALPAPTLPASAAKTINTAAPPPLGTTFALDPNGFVIATPDGALTPDGVMVFAGRPALVPAPRPGTVQIAPPIVEPTGPDIPQIRPRARPKGLIEGNERLQLGGRTRSELAALRPRPRPATPRAQDQADAITAALAADNAAAGNPSTAVIVSPTKQAVAASIGPKARPRGFAKIVERTRKRGADASDGSVAIAAASPRQTVAPKIPTRASVAKQATIKNAINLRKVSLIGIYGSASARRALVRLPSGRYVKVKPGSRLDGGKVVSISATKLVYKKGSRSLTLQVLPFG